MLMATSIMRSFFFFTITTSLSIHCICTGSLIDFVLMVSIRVAKDDIPILANALCTQKGQFVVDWKVCILLKRLAYPCRYFDLIYTFARPVPELCLITNTLLDGMYNEHGFRLLSWNQPFFSPATLQEYSQAITRKGNPLTNCFWAHKRHCSSKLLLRGKTTCSLQWTQADPWSQIPICCPFK